MEPPHSRFNKKIMTTCSISGGLPAIEWISYWLNECAYTSQDQLSVIFGYVAMTFWLFAQIPQLVKNAYHSSSEAISMLFLFNWLFGDVCNLIGCLLTKQLPFQTNLAIYFVFIDFSLLLQTSYFRLKRKIAKDEEEIVNLSIEDPEEVDPLLPSASSSAMPSSSYFAVGLISSVSASEFIPVVIVDEYYKIGRFFAWTCCALYLTSRIPQIVLNMKRKSCHGLAINMILLALLGNLFTTAAILSKSLRREHILNSLPYLLGSGGTVLFDVIIFAQYNLYQ